MVYLYYTGDYLGNNRAVISSSTGVVGQRTAYYPYGGVIVSTGPSPTASPTPTKRNSPKSYESGIWKLEAGNWNLDSRIWNLDS